MLRSEAAPEIVSEFSTGLPPLPIAARRLVTELQDSRTDPRAVARIVQTDAALAARLLTIVNSAYFGLPRKLGNIQRAIILLGYAQIKAIVYRSLLHEAAPKEGVDDAILNRMWERSYMLSVAAPALAQSARGPLSPNLSTAGLFIDVGRIALLARYGNQIGPLYAECVGDERLLARREEEAVGLNHAVAGAILAESWNLPADVVTMIDCHLQAHFASTAFLPPTEMKNVALLHLAEGAVDRFLATQDSAGLPESRQPAPVFFELLGLEPSMASVMTPKVVAALTDGKAFIERAVGETSRPASALQAAS